MKKELSDENIVIPPIRIRSKSVFNLQELYDSVIGFLRDHSYYIIQKGQTEKTKSDGKEIETEWKATRKIDDYLRFQIKIHFLFLRCNNVLVEEDGRKIKKQAAEVQIMINSLLEKDYYKKFKNRDFLRILYERYIIRKRIIEVEDKLRDETNQIIDLIKDSLKYIGKLKT